MKITYENELRSLQNWINNANNGLRTMGTVTLDFASAKILVTKLIRYQMQL